MIVLLYTQVLKNPKVFTKLYRKGRFCACKAVVAYFMPNRLPFTRFAVSASKKIGNAVERNRAKRILRELYRQNEMKMPIGYDIVFVAREDIKDKKTPELEYFIPRLTKEMSKEK